MPVTAKLSGKFYERLGDEIANELVEWFNAVDSNYQGQLKEMNDLNWARMEARFAAFDARMDAFEARMDAFEARMKADLVALEARVDVKIARLRSELIFWMFGFWTATVIPLAALILALSGTFRR
ncbi:MAG: hypothetical protein ABR582_14090 [Gemmatimonadaceae bacterium]